MIADLVDILFFNYVLMLFSDMTWTMQNAIRLERKRSGFAEMISTAHLFSDQVHI